MYADKYKENDCFLVLHCTFASVHLPGFWVFSLFITGSVGGICHSPVEGGNELWIPGSSSQNILKPLLAEFEVGMATPIPPFLAEKKMVRQSKMISAITDLKYLKKEIALFNEDNLCAYRATCGFIGYYMNMYLYYYGHLQSSVHHNGYT